MKIETQQDWNAVLIGCGCCPMPECPVPTKECESITKDICGFALPIHPDNAPEDACRRFAVKTSVFEWNYTALNDHSYTHENASSGLESITEHADYTYTETKGLSDGACVTTFEEESNSSYVSVFLERNGDGTGDNFHIGKKTTTTETTTGSRSSASPVCAGQSTSQTDVEYGILPENQPEPPLPQYPYPPDLPPDEPGTLVTTDGGTCSGGPLSPTADWTKDAETYTLTDPEYDSDPGGYESFSSVATYTVAYSEELLSADLFDGYSFPEDANGSVCAALRECSGATKVRFRWIVPESHTGSYFKITWQILTEPDGWDDEESESPPERSLSEDQTWVWDGPGDPEDEDSWKSGWYDIEPPSVPGTRRVVNIRFECYRSTKFGVKPQVTGEGVEL